MNVVGIRLRRADRVHYFDSGPLDLDVDDRVIVEVEGEPRLGWVVIASRQLLYSEVREPLTPVLRKATYEDLAKS